MGSPASAACWKKSECIWPVAEFTPFGFEREIADHSTFSKNRHGCFRQPDVFPEVFEQIVGRLSP